MSNKHFLAAMYLRLSKDDSDVGSIIKKTGTLKSESNSIANQRELIRAFIHEQQDIELYDIYVDDGYSGSNFDRPEFKRMISDIEAKKVNCVIVKDLSRFGRDYIETGKYIQKIFPVFGVRFIAITDQFDSFKTDIGEREIILPIKNFMNDSYCRDISIKVKSQFEVKRKNGEYIAAFAAYGYKKSENNRNQLVIDEYAAQIVRNIFDWKIEGMAISAIATKLNQLGIFSPKEYKKSIGIPFHGGFSSGENCKWSGTAIKRILTNEIYLGHLIQGKTEKINYKIKKNIQKSQSDWVKVENTHEAIISNDTFEVVQNLLKTDGRISPTSKQMGIFSGLLFCGDCGEQMVRRVNRYKDTKKVYYICSTKNRGEGCSRHSIEEENLKWIVTEFVKCYANCFLNENELFEKLSKMQIDFERIISCNTELARLRKEQDKYYTLCFGLHEDLRQGIITTEEFERLHNQFQRKVVEYENARMQQENLIKQLFKKGVASGEKIKIMQTCVELKEIDRHTLCSMVKRIDIYENKRIEITFYYMDCFRIMQEINREIDNNEQGIFVQERSA